MKEPMTTATCYQCELEIEIRAARERVWKAIFDETNFWWLPDFHVVDAESTVSFDPNPGGRGLLEEGSNGDILLWYSVQMYLPSQYAVYLIGHIAPEWGGPTTSNLKLSVAEADDGCKLIVTDARHGNIDRAQTSSFKDGWTQLFSDGLKNHVEKNQTQ